MEKYYFVYYEVYKRTWNSNGVSQQPVTMKAQTIIDTHPIQFQINCNEKYEKIHNGDGDYKTSERYTIISWNELTKEEYEQYKGKV